MAKEHGKRIEEWLRSLPVWMQHVAADFFAPNEEPQEIQEDHYWKLAENEATGESVRRPEQIEVERLLPLASTGGFRIKEIGSVIGVNRISSDQPLKFSGTGITVVYGYNGTGKSGYVRLIKRIAGIPSQGKLLPDVFTKGGPPGSCKLSTSEGEHSWKSGDMPIPDIAGVQVFDEEAANRYRVDEYSLSYEPPVLGVFDSLISMADELRRRANEEIRMAVSALPQFPQPYRESESYRKWRNVDRHLSLETVIQDFSWSKEDEEALNHATNQRGLYGSDEHVRKQKSLLDSMNALRVKLQSQVEMISDERVAELDRISSETSSLKRLSSAQAQELMDKAYLAGLVSDEWWQLWQSAKAYSEDRAYIGQGFPNVGEGARCVLCQQELDEDAAVRLQSFHGFVEGDLKSRYSKAVLHLASRKPDVRTWMSQDDVLIQCRQVMSEVEAKQLSSGYDDYVRERALLLQEADANDNIAPYEEPMLLSRLADLILELEVNIRTLEGPEAQAQKLILGRQISELQARKWASEQVGAITREIDRLKRVHVLQRTKSLLDTTDLTNEKKRLAEEMTLGDVRARFTMECATLCTKVLSVDLRAAKGDKGKVLTKVTLKDAKISAEATSVLSEGEQRAVALAAFLADSGSMDNAAPFIFDDPVSSLDHRYESRVAERLVALSKARQVVVFTHRLTFANAIKEASEKNGLEPDLVYMASIGNKCGRPLQEWPFKESGLNSRVSKLVQDSVPELRRLLGQDDLDGLRDAQEKTSARLRECVEQSVEYKLCGGVVQRFSKEIRTKDRLPSLSIVTIEDCRLLDDLMTRYSYDVHLQPDERPYVLPEVEQIIGDIQALAAWIKGFDERKKAAPSIGTALVEGINQSPSPATKGEV